MIKSSSQNWNVGGKSYCLPKYKAEVRIGRETATKQESEDSWAEFNLAGSTLFLLIP